MPQFRLCAAMLCACAVSLTAAAELGGPLVRWNFDEGNGDVARDSSGNGRDAKLIGAGWAKDGEVAALNLNGMEGCVESSKLPIAGPITLAMWVKPMRKGHGEAWLAGESYSSYAMTYVNGELLYWYVGSGVNKMRGRLNLGQWNHVAGTFDGETLSLWINGLLVSRWESLLKTYTTGGAMLFGTPASYTDAQRFKGMLSKVRIYGRAMADEEIAAQFKAEAPAYGFDTTWFSRLKLNPHFYFDRGEALVEADYKGLMPLAGKGTLEVTLANSKKPKKALWRQSIETSEAGVAEIVVPIAGVARGDYVLRAVLRDAAGAKPVEEVSFSYPPRPTAVPDPAERAIAAALAVEPIPFDCAMGRGGGFQVTIKGAVYPFESRISWPNGEFNRLNSADASYDKAEKSWKVRVQDAGKDRWTADAVGDFYAVHRDLQVFSTHVQVKDTYTNLTDNDLGLLIYNETPLKAGQLTGSWLSGYEERGRQKEGSEIFYSPNAFFTDAHSGIGVVPVDDVYVIQGVPYIDWQGAAGVMTEKFALPPEASYTLEWAVYPVGSGDYYDFVNAFRRAEGRIGTVEGLPSFISFGPMNRRQTPDRDFIEKRNLKIGIVSSISKTADDPELSIEGIEFVDFPKEMNLLRGQADAIHREYPWFKVVFHIAHSLYLTNKPDRFADSKVIGPDGTQPEFGAAEVYISKRRQDEGWKWWLYYPTPGNSFHDAMMKSVDVMMDELGFDGGYMDGFFSAYGAQWSYDTDRRWDGHTVEMDMQTKTIKRKVNSVLLLSQPSMIEYARKIRDKGGVVVAGGSQLTRSIANEKYILFHLEVISGPQQHFAPVVMAMANNATFRTDKDIYLDMLDKLSWGELFMYYNERIKLAYPTLASREYPMTFEEIRPGMVRGRERIVTMNSGVYEWPGDRNLHLVTKFDDRGAQTAHDCVSTVDRAGVRTELKLSKDESAVIEPVPVTLDAQSPVNVRVIQYSRSLARLMLNGHGEATVDMFVGSGYPDKRTSVYRDGGVNPLAARVGAPYRVTVNDSASDAMELDGLLTIPLDLNGQTEVVIERVEAEAR